VIFTEAIRVGNPAIVSTDALSRAQPLRKPPFSNKQRRGEFQKSIAREPERGVSALMAATAMVPLYRR
jgi:hypothetical protein